MSRLLWVESFDMCSGPQIARKWTSGAANITPGRTGNCHIGGAFSFPNKTFNEEFSKLTFGFAYKTWYYANSLQIMYNTTNGVQIELDHVGDGRMQIRASMSGGTGFSAPSTFIMHTDQWYYVEFQVEIINAVPSPGKPRVLASARINGVEILTMDYTHNTNLSNVKMNRVSHVGPGGGGNCMVDDVYVTDDEFLGDVRIGVLWPNAPGDAMEWESLAAGGSSYTHPQGSGNRVSRIVVTTSPATLNNQPSFLVNGTYGNDAFITSGAAAGRWIKFDFNEPVICHEVKILRENATEYGSWQWYGSNDDAAWTPVGPVQTAWTVAGTVINSLAGNVSAYRYYKFEGLSGNLTQTYNREFEFKLEDADTSNWRQVDEQPADDDASYVFTPTVGAKDLYHLTNIDPSFVGTIKGVQAHWCAKKSDEGVGAIKGLWKSGETEIVQASGHNYLAPLGWHPSATSYMYDVQTERKSLFTGGDWTKEELDNLQIGIVRTL